MTGDTPFTLDADSLRERFERAQPLTVGLEEEVFLVDPESLDLVPRATEVLRRLDQPARFKSEMPAAQLEIVTSPAPTAAAAMDELAAGRGELIAAAGDLCRPVAAGVHPFAAAAGPITQSPQYAPAHGEYRPIAHRQLVAALQVHVAVGGAERTLAVYNALRSHLPHIAALAANGPFHDGRDTGMASYRPKIAETLPRQGVPPAFASWDEFCEALQWGLRSGTVPRPGSWWWELRPHLEFGTLEVRVPDSQTSLEEAGAIVGTIHALVADLAERHDRGERPPVVERWRIEENRWSAARHGVEGGMADYETGDLIPTRDVLTALLDRVEPRARALGTSDLLAGARRLVGENGALRQRQVAERAGLDGLVVWLADRYTEGPPG